MDQLVVFKRPRRDELGGALVTAEYEVATLDEPEDGRSARVSVMRTIFRRHVAQDLQLRPAVRGGRNEEWRGANSRYSQSVCALWYSRPVQAKMARLLEPEKGKRMMDKATYTPPQISVLGTLEELTLGTGAALSDNCALTPAPIANAPSPVDPCGKP